MVFFTILVPTTARKQCLLHYFCFNDSKKARSSLLFLFQRQQESKEFFTISVPTTARSKVFFTISVPMTARKHGLLCYFCSELSSVLNLYTQNTLVTCSVELFVLINYIIHSSHLPLCSTIQYSRFPSTGGSTKRKGFCFR
jgi:hypothetical protein